jgi:hypothetical protein
MIAYHGWSLILTPEESDTFAAMHFMLHQLWLRELKRSPDPIGEAEKLAKDMQFVPDKRLQAAIDKITGQLIATLRQETGRAN